MPEVELRAITKRYGAFAANDGVNLRVRPGTIHGIVGENGAGKSTAMKILFGLTSPTTGEVVLDGRPMRWKSPQDAIARGIGMVHQHFMLAGPHTVLDNILLGAEPFSSALGWLPKGLRPIQRTRARAQLKPWVEKYAPGLDLDSPVEGLAVGGQQKIEILKLLYRDARVLILDEPTAVLTPRETDELFVRLGDLRDEGRSILIITHKLREVLSLTDDITVLRAGKSVAHLRTRETSERQLAEAMVGREIDLDAVSRLPRKAPSGGRPAALQVEGLILTRGRGGAERRLLSDLSFSVSPGEVVGIAGVDGNGQTELIHCVAGTLVPEWKLSGRISMGGERVDGKPSSSIRKMSFGIVPEDRHAEGLLLSEAVEANVLLGHQRSPRFVASRKWLGIEWTHFSRLKQETLEILRRLDVRPADPSRAAGAFSGGNQQKIILGRELSGQPRFLLVAQPTRGVDVGAVELIHRQILNARDGGAGVLLLSSELDEVLALSDRLLVMYHGKIVGELARGSFERGKIGLWMGGAS